MQQIEYKSHSSTFFYDELLPCPFCGGEANINFIGNDHSKKRKVEVKCSSCRVELINASIRNNSEVCAKWTIDGWNKRI